MLSFEGYTPTSLMYQLN
jgi:hypothetical protein